MTTGPKVRNELPAAAEVTVRDFPGRQMRLTMQAADEIKSQAELARTAVAAILAFGSGWWQPLSADLTLICCDPQFWYPLSDHPPHPQFRTLFAADAVASVQRQSAWEGAQERSVARISEATLVDWMIESLDAPCGGDGSDGTVVGWQELLVRSARVKLPDGVLVGSGRSELSVAAGAGISRVPVEWSDGVAWVSGPRAGRGDTAPLDLRVTHLAGAVTLDIFLHWSPWADVAGHGEQDVDAAVRRVQSLGWQLSS